MYPYMHCDRNTVQSSVHLVFRLLKTNTTVHEYWRYVIHIQGDILQESDWQLISSIPLDLLF